MPVTISQWLAARVQRRQAASRAKHDEEADALIKAGGACTWCKADVEPSCGYAETGYALFCDPAHAAEYADWDSRQY